jgi:hypothetical protein
MLFCPGSDGGSLSSNASPQHMEPSARHLALHGAIVLFIGLVCGGPYGRAINRSAPAHIIQSWRVAHASLPMGGILMLAVAGLLSHFSAEVYVKWLISLAFIASSYAFCVSLPLAAVVGHRGLSGQGPPAAKIVFAGNVVGAWLSAVGTIALIYAAFASL